MNPNLSALLQEGFSVDTLFSLTEQQLKSLHERVKKSKKETKEAELLLDPKNPEDMNMAKEKGLMTPDGKIKTKMESEVTEKAVSKKQQQFFGIVRGMQKGDIPKKGKAGEKAKEMKMKDVKDFASTKHKGLPKKVETKEGDKKFIQKATEKIEKKGTEGKFGSWCKKQGLDSDGEVTKKCITAGLKSDDSKVVKMANFAKNIGGFKGSKHNNKKDTKEEVKKIEESIMKIIENYNTVSISKSDLIKTINRYK